MTAEQIVLIYGLGVVALLAFLIAQGFDLGIKLLVVLALVVIGLAVWWEVAIWQECRTDHSWGYCMRVLSK